MSKTTVVFHSADFDGIFCREIARKFLPEAELIGWDFGDAPLEFPENGTVYVLDLPPDRPFGVESVTPEMAARMVWIDHHASSLTKYNA